MKTEHEEQRNFVNWMKKKSLVDYRYGLIFAIPNGGKRGKITAAKLKLEGVRPGIPDLFLPVPTNLYHGLFIEMKRYKGGTLSKNQIIWLNALLNQGYLCKVGNGAEEAKDIVRRYLK